ncbi:MAG: hypothetical protein FWC62_06905 [Firmicutes bacterium]|nr:hypothetical protein [Bacillota bacterium]
MAGFFGFFDYNKPGKGVDKNAPAKCPFFLFLALTLRKFWLLILLNLIYFVILLPLLTAAYFLLYGYMASLIMQTGAQTAGGVDPSQVTLPLLPGMLLTVAQSLPIWLSAALLAASAVFYGPASCGLAFMLRNFALQEHVWVSDFFVKLKENFKQGLALGLTDILLLCLFAFDLTYAAGSGASFILLILRYVSGALLVIYLFMRNYFFIMAVTFRLKVSQIFKNAFFLAALGWKRNLLILLINGALFALVLFVSQFAELVLAPVLLFSLTGFVSVFTCFPVVKKYLLPPPTE